MKRRLPSKAELVELPASLRVFIEDEWAEPFDEPPPFAHWLTPAQARWRQARHAWLLERGLDIVEILVAERAERLAAFEREAAAEGGTWGEDG